MAEQRRTSVSEQESEKRFHRSMDDELAGALEEMDLVSDEADRRPAIEPTPADRVGRVAGTLGSKKHQAAKTSEMLIAAKMMT